MSFFGKNLDILNAFYSFLINLFQIKQVRAPLTAGMLMMLVGNMIYLSMEGMPVPKRYILLICRFVTGMGSGGLGVFYCFETFCSVFKTSIILYVV